MKQWEAWFFWALAAVETGLILSVFVLFRLTY